MRRFSAVCWLEIVRLAPAEQRRQIMTELAVALYARGILSFGKARELTALNRVEFGLLLGRRGMESCKSLTIFFKIHC